MRSVFHICEIVHAHVRLVDFGISVVLPVVNQDGGFSGFKITFDVSCENRLCILVKCFHQKFWILSIPGLFQFANLLMLTCISASVTLVCCCCSILIESSYSLIQVESLL